MAQGIGGATTAGSLRDVLQAKMAEVAESDNAAPVEKAKPGVLAAAAATPTATGAVFAQHMARLASSMQSLDGSLASAPMGDIEVLVASTLEKMQKSQETIDKNKVVSTQAKQQAALKEKAGKLEKAIEKQEEAAEKQKNMSIWQKIALAFQWLGAILSMVAGAIMVATGVGAAAGGLLIAAGVAQMIMAVDATVKEATGTGIAGHIARASGASEEDVAKADQIFGYVMTGITAVLGIAAVFAGPGVAGAIGSSVKQIASTFAQEGLKAGLKAALNALKNLPSLAKELGMKAMEELSKNAQAFQLGTQFASYGVGVGSAITGIGSSATAFEASKASAEAKEKRADASDLDALVQMLQQAIDQLLSILMRSGEQMAQALDTTVGAMNDRAQTLGRTQFAG
ncbi:type III secretion system translocon subunit SctE [Polycladidibacter hongkongensis]|uniref:type III secretion system translocon subunit SctE n=1 Tax=Polycladidibacter hongkongensis TaxID=1647556 RepID=UPI0008303F5F|nr:type III secretion system translocon subunit SctE [Pseudovibrio hongkongensis]